jgi:5'-3' exonuclease
MNGKKNSWEGLVLVPFVDQHALLRAVETIPTTLLTKEDLARNDFGNSYVYQFDSTLSLVVPSPVPFFETLTQVARLVEQYFALFPKRKTSLFSSEKVLMPLSLKGWKGFRLHPTALLVGQTSSRISIDIAYLGTAQSLWNTHSLLSSF